MLKQVFGFGYLVILFQVLSYKTCSSRTNQFVNPVKQYILKVFNGTPYFSLNIQRYVPQAYKSNVIIVYQCLMVFEISVFH